MVGLGLPPLEVSRGAVWPGLEHQDAGAEAVREKGFGMTTPLLTTASGEKFGKSAENAIWLDETMTPVFDFYQVSFLGSL